MTEVLDGPAARRWVDAAVMGLDAARERIDALNVYPVPDGDTGTNLHLTAVGAQRAVQVLGDGATLPEIAEAAARGALMGARGNSGIILSQLLRGWSDALGQAGQADADLLRSCLSRADDEAWAAVEKPVVGTMLSVTRAAAEGARDAGGSLAEVMRAAVAAAREALVATTDQLDVLREAGVVDAGGCGVVVLLEALVYAVTGAQAQGLSGDLTRPPTMRAAHDGACPNGAPGGPSFEVMYLLDSTDEHVAALRVRLGGLGDSLVVVGGGGLWHVHVHTDEPGAAVEAGIEVGRPHQVRIAHLAAVSGDGGRTTTARPRDDVGVVAWAAGPGLAAAFRACGVVPVVGVPGRRASTGEVLAEVRATGTEAVVVLPNDTATLAVAQAAALTAHADGLRVTVVPTRAQVQGLAAAAVHDRAADLDDDVVAMTAAAGATRHGAVTVAARDAYTMAGRCGVGDVLGVIDGDFVVIGDSMAAVATEVADRLLSGGGELLTLVTGADAPPGLAAAVAAGVRARRREVEVVMVDGGQPRYPLLVGVE